MVTRSGRRAMEGGWRRHAQAQSRTIYQFAYSLEGNEQDLTRYLPERRSKRRPGYGRKPRSLVFPIECAIPQVRNFGSRGRSESYTRHGVRPCRAFRATPVWLSQAAECARFDAWGWCERAFPCSPPRRRFVRAQSPPPINQFSAVNRRR